MADGSVDFPIARLFRRHESKLLLALAVVVVLIGLLDSQHGYFYHPWNSLEPIIRQTSLLGIYALGAAIVIIAGGIDLSAGSMIAFSGTICATLLLWLAPEQTQSKDAALGLGTITIAIGGTLLVGLLVGSLHAWLITVVGLPPFVATLATLVGLRSFARAICLSVTDAVGGGQSTQINVPNDTFRHLSKSGWIPAVSFLILAAICWLILSKTVLGRHLYALGGNEEAARLSGIRTNGQKWFAYCASALLASIAGIFHLSEVSVAEPHSMGRGYELNAIAAAVVGGCSLQGGVGTIPGTVLGTIFLRTVMDGVDRIIKTGADVYEGLIVGVVVVFAVAFSQLDAARSRRGFFAGPLGLVAAINLALFAGTMGVLIGPMLLGGWISLEGRFLGLWVGTLLLALLLIARIIPARSLRWATFAWAIVAGLSLIALEFGVPAYRLRVATSAVASAGGKVSGDAQGRAVDLSGTTIDDGSLKRLVALWSRIPRLLELSLARTPIGDEGAAALKQLSSLRQLDLTGTKVSPEMVRNLNRTLPDVKIVQ